MFTSLQYNILFDTNPHTTEHDAWTNLWQSSAGNVCTINYCLFISSFINMMKYRVYSQNNLAELSHTSAGPSERWAAHPSGQDQPEFRPSIRDVETSRVCVCVCVCVWVCVTVCRETSLPPPPPRPSSPLLLVSSRSSHTHTHIWWMLPPRSPPIKLSESRWQKTTRQGSNWPPLGRPLIESTKVKWEARLPLLKRARAAEVGSWDVL